MSAGELPNLINRRCNKIKSSAEKLLEETPQEKYTLLSAECCHQETLFQLGRKYTANVLLWCAGSVVVGVVVQKINRGKQIALCE